MEFNWGDEVDTEFDPDFPTPENVNSNDQKAENEESVNSILDQNTPFLKRVITRIAQTLTSFLPISIDNKNISKPDEITISQPQIPDDITIVPSQNHGETTKVQSSNLDEAIFGNIAKSPNFTLQIPLSDVKRSDGQIIYEDFPFTDMLSTQSVKKSKTVGQPEEIQRRNTEPEPVPTTSYAEYRQTSRVIRKPKKSVTFFEPMVIVPKSRIPTLVKKCVKFAEPITTYYEYETEKLKKNVEPDVELSTISNTPAEETIEPSLEISVEADTSTSQALIHSLPLSFGAIEYIKQKTLLEVRTEDVRRLIEELNIEMIIPLFPLSKRRAPMACVNTGIRRPSYRDSRPVVHGYPRVLLELTLSQPLIVNSLRENYHFYMKRGLQFKYLGGRTILMLFRNEHDAKEVLGRPCCLGIIVPVAQASKRTKEVVSRYRSHYFHYRI